MEESKPRTRPRKTAAGKTAVAKAPAKADASPRPRKATKTTGAAPTLADWEARVRQAAYFRAERRGFAPGHEAEDWLAAEAEVAGALGPKPKPKAPGRTSPARKKVAG
jgi:Protein of unknown function (DUF2934)